MLVRHPLRESLRDRRPGPSRRAEPSRARVGGHTAPRGSPEIVCDGARLFAPLAEQFSNLQAMDKAESKSTSVAAASILAKDLRDAAFEEIAQRYRESYGELRGGGYPNAATRAFLDWHLAEFGALPPETRTSWGQRTRPSSTTR
ncbi:MAG: hypothetical protein ACPHRO_00980 [Nannocystaceae bacterium]